MGREILTLRIKRVYLEAIRTGVKKVEYRKDTPFYARRFARRYTHLRLHYQHPTDQLVVQIATVRLIDRPKEFEHSEMLPTPKVWAIYLK